MNSLMRWVRGGFVFFVFLALPTVVQAHPGHGAGGFWAGAGHPMGGWDHLLAMLAVGLWSVQLGGRALWLVPLTFVGVMALGGWAGMEALPLPLVETGILASVFILGLLIMLAVRVPLWAGMLLVAAFALFHGYAHGTEMPLDSLAPAYAAGFVLATGLLHLLGACGGLGLQKMAQAPLIRWAGLAVVLAGVTLLF